MHRNNNTMAENQKDNIGHISKDDIGNIIINKEGCVTYTCGDLIFQLPYSEIDFTYDTLQCTVADKTIFIELHENAKNIPLNNNIAQKPSQEYNRKEIFSWNDARTKLFLTLYKEHKELLATRKIKTHKLLWQKIAELMQSHGYNTTVSQVENKFKSLERSYKNMITNNKQTGRGRVSCTYETELTELLGHKHNIEPLAVTGRQGLILREEIRANTFTSNNDTNVDEPSNSNNTILNDNTSYLASQPSTSETNIHPINTTDINTSNRTDTNITQNITQQITQTSNKISRKHMGTTGRLLQTCQKTLQDISNNIEEDRAAKLDIQKQMLAEYKHMRNTYTESFNNINDN
ncbi:putative uncharacterized protein DDB_G0293878 [Harpegnathos saltator]|uniref:putative uncharacterized protein DDB_G0293878 n=1 Tax=Harpegnathos saltator TaxID=610380 RepID=UPI000DBEDF22|nr:putative uncharacterized protein DDB_G0293878 [Harpegnathos saltator]